MNGRGANLRHDPDFPWLSCGDFFRFPDPEAAEGSVVAAGGNLSPGMVLSAYVQGIFPWFNEDDPLLWHSPDPRFVLFPEFLHIPSRLRRAMKKPRFRITADRAFEEVLASCAEIPRPGQQGTWITADMRESCLILRKEGFMHSVEAWDGSRLAGGFYGMQIGPVFFGESMFSREPDSSKTAFAVFAGRFFGSMGGTLIDSQVYTDHMARFGARNISRQAYIRLLHRCFSGCDIQYRKTGVPSSLFQRVLDWSPYFP